MESGSEQDELGGLKSFLSCGHILRCYVLRNTEGMVRDIYWAGQKVCLGFWYSGTLNPNELFGQPNVLSAIACICRAQKCLFQVNDQVPVVSPLNLMGKAESQKEKKWMEVSFPVTNNCLYCHWLRKNSKGSRRSQFYNLPFLAEWVITLLHIPKM